MARRSYGQFCGLAHALDVLGERWTLLIVRDLMWGPMRYRDLAARQPGLSSDQLTSRLRHLEQHGIVERVARPPSAAKAYALTRDGGDALRPVVEALARFGAAQLPDPVTTADRMDISWAFQTLALSLDDRVPHGDGVIAETDTGVGRLLRRDGRAMSGDGTSAAADVRLVGDTKSVLGVLLGHIAVDDASAFDVEIHGDEEVLADWIAAIAEFAPAALLPARLG